MDFKEYLVENSEKDMISKIYHNDMEDLQCISESKDYFLIVFYCFFWFFYVAFYHYSYIELIF